MNVCSTDMLIENTLKFTLNSPMVLQSMKFQKCWRRGVYPNYFYWDYRMNLFLFCEIQHTEKWIAQRRKKMTAQLFWRLHDQFPSCAFKSHKTQDSKKPCAKKSWNNSFNYGAGDRGKHYSVSLKSLWQCIAHILETLYYVLFKFKKIWIPANLILFRFSSIQIYLPNKTQTPLTA